MKPYSTLFLFTLLTLTTVPAQADIIDDTIGNIQQAINDAYNPDRGRDYEDSRDDGWQREVSDDRRRQYDDRRRQFEDRRRQLDDRQHQLDQERRQLEDEERRMEDEYGQCCWVWSRHRPSGERVRVRGPARTFPLITPPQSPSHQTPPQTPTAVCFPSAMHQTDG